jgi:hypothetical protein
MIMTRQQVIEKAMLKFPKARRIAVENASSGFHKGNFDMGAQMNLEADQACYKWNSATMKAIYFCIENNPTN